MEIGSLVSTGLQGMNRGMQDMQKNAEAIASSDFASKNGGANAVNEMVDLRANELQVKASAAVVKTADETLGTILDIRA